jgi:hypothetical protein
VAARLVELGRLDLDRMAPDTLLGALIEAL